jgi:hypothetical protein
MFFADSFWNDEKQCEGHAIVTAISPAISLKCWHQKYSNTLSGSIEVDTKLTVYAEDRGMW